MDIQVEDIGETLSTHIQNKLITKEEAISYLVSRGVSESVAFLIL